MQNSQKDKVQSDIRIRIMKRLYYTIFDVPILKKKEFSHLSIYWNSIPPTFLGKVFSKIFNIYRFLNIDEYSKVQRNSKIYLNSKSPMNLISPRYFENIASGCLIITEKNKELRKLIPKSSYNEFLNDLSNFDNVLFKTLERYEYSKKKIKINSNIIRINHTWDSRVKLMLKLIGTFKKNKY